MFESKISHPGYKVINYDSYETNDNLRNNNYTIENKKERNPFSEIDKYDNYIETDKPYNYFSNYNYNITNPPPAHQVHNNNFRKTENFQSAGLYKTNINEVNPLLFRKMENNIFNTNSSINYLEEINKKKLRG